MCNLRIEGTVGIVDLAKCPFEFASPEFINYHLKDLSTITKPLTKIRYEEEVSFELSEEATSILVEYAKVIAQIEAVMLRKDIYGVKQDPHYNSRVEALRKFYTYTFMNPLIAARELEGYKEPTPDTAAFMKSYETFVSWKNGILRRFKETQLYKLVEKTGDLRSAFLSLVGLQSLFFVNLLALELPKGAVKAEGPDTSYKLEYGNEVQIYEVPEKDMFIYHLRNPIMESLTPELKTMLKKLIDEQMKENFSNADFNIIFDLKAREYKQFFMESALLQGIEITPEQALVMGREAAAWVVGLGSPIENIALDWRNITDIYIDSENSPIYLEHRKFGIVHTLFRYNRELLERAFRNMILAEKGTKFDENNPIADVVLKRHSMRCHLTRPPATFGEFQGALRIMQEEPFTYPQYLYLRSFSPFFAGYDDVMVTLGCSEAVLGLKGSGKTAFTAAKITAMGPGKRIIPIQDIQEIPVRAFRKRGFHIGAAKVQSSEKEVPTGKELDLVTMANALLRMGDAALVINEIRSRVAVQGVINLLNTQPGVFLLYNLHAESLEDVRDRLELVFGIPSASMFATDRYTFLKKVRFGRKGRIYRVLGYEFESDRENKAFVQVFEYKRGTSIENSVLNAKFIRNPEANINDFSNVDVGKLEKELDIETIPPVLKRRSEETGIRPEQYILQAFYKGKVYHDIYKASVESGVNELMGLDFVLKANTLANKIMVSIEKEGGEVDFGRAQREWEEQFRELVKRELPLLRK